MQLYDKGCFNLDDDISKYLPFEIKNPWHPDKNITFRMILSHQASFNDFGIRFRYLPFMLSQAWLKNNSYSLLKEMLTPGGKIYNKWFFLRSEPGEKALYDEIGFVIAGYLVEQISGQTLENYCQENIFKPLGMNNTSFYPDKLNKKQIARPYVNVFHMFSPLPRYNLFFFRSSSWFVY